MVKYHSHDGMKSHPVKTQHKILNKIKKQIKEIQIIPKKKEKTIMKKHIFTTQI